MTDIELLREHRKYKRMYYRLFNCYSDALNCKTKEETDEILKKAQIDAEGIYTGDRVFTEFYLSDESGIINVLKLARFLETQQPEEYISYECIASIDEWIEELKNEMPEMPEKVKFHRMAMFGEEYDL